MDLHFTWCVFPLMPPQVGPYRQLPDAQPRAAAPIAVLSNRALTQTEPRLHMSASSMKHSFNILPLVLLSTQ